MENAKVDIEVWIELGNQSGINEFIGASNSIENRLEYIVNSFIDERYTNGFTEGKNLIFKCLDKKQILSENIASNFMINDLIDYIDGCNKNKKWIFCDQDDSNSDSIDFTMKIENIGLNTVRKVYLEVESELFNKKEIFELCNQSNIEKNQIKTKEVIITNVAKGTYKIKITVYYQDLLKNWYKQKIHLTILVTNIYNSKAHDCNRINSAIVDDEEKLSREPSFVKKIKKS